MEGACWPWGLSKDGGESCAGVSGLVGGPAQATGFFCFSQHQEMKLQFLPPPSGRAVLYFPLQHTEMSAGWELRDG